MRTKRTGRRLTRPVNKQASRRKAAPSARERLALIRLVVCGSAFVLLVAVKLLLPGKLALLGDRLTAAMERSVDVRAVFSAVGDLFTQEATPREAADEVYQAVFHPEEASETAADTALRELKRTAPVIPAGEDEETLDLVLYAEEDLPEHVSMEQAILGFDHQTPVRGTLSSAFGFREHPTEGAERFHYGVDLAADSGTAIGCFADGTVVAVGDSSSYGHYCTVSHDNGCTTLYAHCSRVTVSSGEAVKAGDKLGEVGESGMATGPHLHFELQKDGVYLNPVYYVETA